MSKIIFFLQIYLATVISIVQCHSGPLTDPPPPAPTPVTINPHLDLLDERYSKCRGVEIREISVLDIQALFTSNKLTSLELTKCYLERLDRMNQVLRVVVEINPDALNDALRLDIERNLGRNLGLMHGIPVLIKDDIGTLDLTETTVGSPALIGIRPKMEADVVQALRKAGAVILGKSNCQEFHGYRGVNVPYGWSGRGGQTRNAYNLSVTPAGSSSGSTVGVSANLVPVAVGTETFGSILVPASLSGVTGMKPTFGMISTKGVIPFVPSHDHLGPIAKTVLDTAILLDAMMSLSERPRHHPPSYGQSLLENKLTVRPLRVGILRYPFWDTFLINSTNLRNQVPKLEGLIQTIKGSPNFLVIDPVEAAFRNISTLKSILVSEHEMKHYFNEYLRNDVVSHNPIPPSLNNPFALLQTPEAYISVIAPTRRIESLQDVINYNDEHPTSEGYDQEYLLRSQATDGIFNATYVNAMESNQLAAREYLESVFKRYELDALLTPGEGREEGVFEKTWEDFPTCGYKVAALSGYPSINIPVGIGLDQVPFGITVIAKPFEEPTLLRVAYGMEKLIAQRPIPKFLI